MSEPASLSSDAALWQRAFDALPDLIFVVDDSQRIVCANRAVRQRLGCTVEELAGRHCDELIHGTQTPPETCPHARMLQDGPSLPVELHEVSLGGEFAITVTPLSDGQGRTIGSVHVAHDITQQKRAEEAREERTRFECLLADISARLVGVAHDRVDGEIAAALAEVRAFFGFDRLALRTTTKTGGFGPSQLRGLRRRTETDRRGLGRQRPVPLVLCRPEVGRAGDPGPRSSCRRKRRPIA